MQAVKLNKDQTSPCYYASAFLGPVYLGAVYSQHEITFTAMPRRGRPAIFPSLDQAVAHLRSTARLAA
jgi:hypothetical protein